MKSPYDMVLFDLDGTLIETAPEICDAVNDTLCRFKLPGVTQDQVEQWIGHGTRELLLQAVAFASGTDVATVRASDSLRLIADEFDRNYHQRCGTRSRPYAGAVAVLDALRAGGTKLALVTNKEAQYTQRVLDAHRLAGKFERIVSGDTFSTRKPDPSGVLHCLGAFDIPPQRALFIGDSSIDVETARNAGVAVWALSHGYNMGQPIARSNPDRVFAGFGVLREALAAGSAAPVLSPL